MNHVKNKNPVQKGLRPARRYFAAAFICVLLLTAGCTSSSVTQPDPLAQYRPSSLRPAESQKELLAVAASSRDLRKLIGERIHVPPRRTLSLTTNGEEAADLDRVQVTGSRILAADVITNVQTPGIDEGGIVKRAGDILIVLSGSVIHTVLLHENGRDELRLIQSLDLMDEKEKSDTWFDEIIAFDGGVLLLSYNYDDNLTEMRSFAMTSSGQLSEGGRIQIVADDYFSGGNYGLRLVGDQVLFPVSVGLDRYEGTIWPMWRPGTESDWEPLLESDDILLPLVPVHRPTVYSVLQCGLDALLAQQMDCRATGVVAEDWSELYVGPNAAYVAHDAWHDEAYLLDDFSPWSHWRWSPGNHERMHLRRTLIYRIPLDRSEAPGVVSVNGEMGNQFSFVEADGHLIAVTENFSRNGQRVLEAHRVAESDFSDHLPGRVHTFAKVQVSNSHRTIRVTKDHILIGEHGAVLHDEQSFGRDTDFIIQPTRSGRAARLTLPQTVERLELVGAKVFLSGQDAAGQWAFRLIDPEQPWRRGLSTLMPGYVSSEDRSHAFNWRQLANDQIILGLPGTIHDDNKSRQQFWWRSDQTSDLLFFTAQGLDIIKAGIVDMQADNAPGDYCHEDYGCPDWYGNARAIFIDNRILALSGNRLDEAQLVDGQVHPVRSIMLRFQ